MENIWYFKGFSIQYGDGYSSSDRYFWLNIFVNVYTSSKNTKIVITQQQNWSTRHQVKVGEASRESIIKQVDLLNESCSSVLEVLYWLLRKSRKTLVNYNLGETQEQSRGTQEQSRGNPRTITTMQKKESFIHLIHHRNIKYTCKPPIHPLKTVVVRFFLKWLAELTKSCLPFWE